MFRPTLFAITITSAVSNSYYHKYVHLLVNTFSQEMGLASFYIYMYRSL
jgi:hypothetical protein